LIVAVVASVDYAACPVTAFCATNSALGRQQPGRGETPRKCEVIAGFGSHPTRIASNYLARLKILLDGSI
jgi:hypothetical protein